MLGAIRLDTVYDSWSRITRLPPSKTFKSWASGLASHQLVNDEWLAKSQCITCPNRSAKYGFSDLSGTCHWHHLMLKQLYIHWCSSIPCHARIHTLRVQNLRLPKQSWDIGDVFAVQHLLKWLPNDEPDSSPGPCQLLWPPFPWPKLGKREAIGLGEDHRDFLQFAMENGPDMPRDDQHDLGT